jgi:hypothetical protein
VRWRRTSPVVVMWMPDVEVVDEDEDLAAGVGAAHSKKCSIASDRAALRVRVAVADD